MNLVIVLFVDALNFVQVLKLTSVHGILICIAVAGVKEYLWHVAPTFRLFHRFIFALLKALHMSMLGACRVFLLHFSALQ